jgi:hypothetical protein
MKKLFLRAKLDFSGSLGKRMKPQETGYLILDQSPRNLIKNEVTSNSAI